jgi:Domain of unknown function (DUF1937)
MQSVYLAQPYKHSDPKVMEWRAEQGAIAAAELTELGYLVYAPIVHNRPLARVKPHFSGWDFWKPRDLPFIEWAELFAVLKLPGWNKSIGVASELEHASLIGKPIYSVILTEKGRVKINAYYSS